MTTQARLRQHQNFSLEELQQLDPQKIAEAYRQAGYFELPKERIPAWLLDDEDRDSAIILTEVEGSLRGPSLAISLNKSHEDWAGHMTSLIWALADTYCLDAADVYSRLLKYSNR